MYCCYCSNYTFCYLAAQNVDQVMISNGQDITLQEDPNLELPFLIPEQGYSCDTMRGLPVGLEEYLDHAMNLGEGYC